MDGNASESEEELFVEELSEQIPIVLRNIESTVQQIDYIENNSLKPSILAEQIDDIKSQVNQTATLV